MFIALAFFSLHKCIGMCSQLIGIDIVTQITYEIQYYKFKIRRNRLRSRSYISLQLLGVGYLIFDVFVSYLLTENL